MEAQHNKRGITVVHDGDFMVYPPVLSLLENLLQKDINVYLVSSTPKESIPEYFFDYESLFYHEIPKKTRNGVLGSIEGLTRYKKEYIKAVEQYMPLSDLLWTTTDGTAKLLGNKVLDYKHVMQLMELIEYMPVSNYLKSFKAPLDVYARAAYKVVVPQIDRAYIQKTWWNLPETPVVLPNKPYHIDVLEKDCSSKTLNALNIIRTETRKVLLYMGVVGPDREIEPFANAVKNMKEYSLYIIGRPTADAGYLNDLLNNCNNITYLGFFSPPEHLAFLRYAYLGIMPYKAEQARHYSKLNALYCAPNKIFEYSGYGIPMIGTDVPGLVKPFEQFGIGLCCRDLKEETIVKSIRQIDSNYDKYKENCFNYYNSIELDKIVEDIING